MKAPKNFVLIISITAAIIISIVFTCIVLTTDRGYTGAIDAKANLPIEIIGNYRIDNGEWREFTKDVKFNTAQYHTITIKGHFSHDIPAGQSLLFYIPRMSVLLKIDGVTAFASDLGNNRQTSRMAGTAWADYVSPGISADSKVELVMRNAYRNSNISFNTLLDNMQTGPRAGLYQKMFMENGGVLAFGLFFIFIGVMAFILTVIAQIWRVPHAPKTAALAFFAIIGGANFLCDLNYLYMPLLIQNPTAASLFDIMPPYVITCVFSICVLAHTGVRIRKALTIFVLTQCTMLFVTILLQILDMVQLYEAQPVFLSITAVTLLSTIALIFIDAFKFNNNEARLFLFIMLPCLVSAALEIANYFFPFIASRLLFAAGLSITLILYIIQVIYMIKRSGEIVLQKQKLENEQTQSQISVMLSQIRPHFLFNSLIAIQGLCLTDPKTAHDAVEDFSKYLRGNIESLSTKKPVPFEKEFHHVKHYLSLEQKRFGDKLQIAYDILTRDFELPALTLQPIAENAVRHGVTKREEGGKIIIATAKTDAGYVITVTDDGVGFDLNEYKTEERMHIGIENVRRRLALMSGGTLEIRSTPDVGTTAAITIPFETSQ